MSIKKDILKETNIDFFFFLHKFSLMFYLFLVEEMLLQHQTTVEKTW